MLLQDGKGVGPEFQCDFENLTIFTRSGKRESTMNGGEKEGEVSKEEGQVSRQRAIEINSKYNKILR